MKQLDPKAVWLFFLSFIARWLFLSLFLSFWGLLSFARTEDGGFYFYQLNWLWLIIPLLILFCFLWAKLTYKFYRYEFTELGFRKESGVIYKKYVTIPYDRIQNVDIYRGIIARILGLSDLNIQTAGSSAVMGQYGAYGVGAEGRLPALSKDVAEQLRDELMRRAHNSRNNQGL